MIFTAIQYDLPCMFNFVLFIHEILYKLSFRGKNTQFERGGRAKDRFK